MILTSTPVDKSVKSVKCEYVEPSAASPESVTHGLSTDSTDSSDNSFLVAALDLTEKTQMSKSNVQSNLSNECKENLSSNSCENLSNEKSVYNNVLNETYSIENKCEVNVDELQSEESGSSVLNVLNKAMDEIEKGRSVNSTVPRNSECESSVVNAVTENINVGESGMAGSQKTGDLEKNSLDKESIKVENVKSVKTESHVEIECEKSVRVKGVDANEDGRPQLTQESEKSRKKNCE